MVVPGRVDRPALSQVPLLCHWRGDSDIALAFVKYYRPFCHEFHIILHGPPEESAGLIALAGSHPLILRHHYDGDFDTQVKTALLNRLAATFQNRWLLVVDSDEMVEFPHATIGDTITALEADGATCLAAPMIQRLRADGSLQTPPVIEDVFAEFPLCAPDLYSRMGSTGSITKYPLFKMSARTRIPPGSHFPPNGRDSASGRIRGVTHHFKWKRNVQLRIADRIRIGQSWAPTESVPYLRYLKAHANRLPLEGAFPYSRQELFARGLLAP